MLRRITKLHLTSLQVENWAIVSNCVLANPDLPVEFVKDLLISKHQDRKLAEPFTFEEVTEQL